MLFVFEGAVVHVQPPDAARGSERRRAGGTHPSAELQDPETGEHPEKVQGLQVSEGSLHDVSVTCPRWPTCLSEE